MAQTTISKQTHKFLKSQTGQMIVGLILGDGSCTNHRFEHSQQGLYWEYSKYISQQFKNNYPELLTPKILTESFYTRKRTNVESPRIYTSQTFYTKRHDIFRELRQVFYPNGKKIIPIEVIEAYFTDVSLLFLYLDDGKVGRAARTGLGLDLANFSHEDLNTFKIFLMGKFQLDITTHKLYTYEILYVKMSSSKELLNRFNQMTEITSAIGLIGPTKLQLKKIPAPKPRIHIDTKFNRKVTMNEFNLTGDSVIGVLQGFITGGSNLLLNKDLQRGYLRLRLKPDSNFTAWVFTILDHHSYPYKKNLTKTSIELGISVSTDFVFFPSEESLGLPQSIYKNPFFLRTLFHYKGRDLTNQRGGLIISLNHLKREDVLKMSQTLNNLYELQSSVRFRDKEKQQKPTLYIPVKNRDQFYKIIATED